MEDAGAAAPNEKVGALAVVVVATTFVLLGTAPCSVFKNMLRGVASVIGIVLLGVVVEGVLGDRGITLGRGAFFHRSLRCWNQARLSFVAIGSSVDIFLIRYVV